MNSNGGRKWSVCAVLAVAALLSVSTQAWAEKPEVVPSPPKPVIVENSDPIPISGEVDANVTGTIPVIVENTDPMPMDGSVLVVNPDPISVDGSLLVVNPDPISIEGTVLVGNTDPIEIEGNVTAAVTGIVEVEDFNSQLNSLKNEVRLVREAVEDLQIGERVPWTWTYDNEFVIKDVVYPPPSGWPDTELIVVSAEDDSIVVGFSSDPECDVNNPNPTWVLRAGAENDEFPTVQTFNLPVPVAIRCIKISCGNFFENCEVIISMIGSRPAP